MAPERFNPCVVVRFYNLVFHCLSNKASQKYTPAIKNGFYIMSALFSGFLQHIRPFILWMMLAVSFPSFSIAQDTDSVNAAILEDRPNDQLEVPAREVPSSVVDSFKRSEDFLYANDPEYWEEKERGSPGFGDALVAALTSRAMRFLSFAALVAVGLFVIYRLIVVSGLLKKTSRTREKEPEPIPVTSTRESVDRDLTIAISQQNFRQAVRLLHLKSLFFLEDKSMISMDAQMTNQQYLNQLINTPYLSEFRFLTRIYEYVWFGDFSLDNVQFTKAEAAFRNFYQRLNN